MVIITTNAALFATTQWTSATDPHPKDRRSDLCMELYVRFMPSEWSNICRLCTYTGVNCNTFFSFLCTNSTLFSSPVRLVSCSACLGLRPHPHIRVNFQKTLAVCPHIRRFLGHEKQSFWKTLLYCLHVNRKPIVVWWLVPMKTCLLAPITKQTCFFPWDILTTLSFFLELPLCCQYKEKR